MSDEELLRAMIAGEEEAFVALYRRRHGTVYRFALQMSGSAPVAEEVTQEVFLALIRDATRFDPERGSFTSYLYGIARHHVLRSLDREPGRFSRHEEHAGSSAKSIDSLASTDDPHRNLDRQQRMEHVRRAILTLPPNYREAVVLCDLHEMSYEDAARTLGCAVGTVRSRLHRGRALLVQKLAGRLRRRQPSPAVLSRARVPGCVL